MQARRDRREAQRRGRPLRAADLALQGPGGPRARARPGGAGGGVQGTDRPRARASSSSRSAARPTDDTLAALEQAARDGDAQTGGERLRRALCASMAHGGQGARDGGKTRGSLMRRAASMAHRDLNDLEQAFTWLGDALIAHVDPLTLDALEGLGARGGRSAPRRGHALARARRGVRRAAGPAAARAPREAAARAARRQDRRRRRPEEAPRSVAQRSGRDGRALGAADRARRLPRDGAALRGPDPPRQGHERARGARAQGRADVGGAARRPARGRRCVAARPADEAGRRRGDGGARAREVEHAEEAGARRRARGLRAAQAPADSAPSPPRRPEPKPADRRSSRRRSPEATTEPAPLAASSLPPTAKVDPLAASLRARSPRSRRRSERAETTTEAPSDEPSARDPRALLPQLCRRRSR